jgi:hypothetical protein
MAAVFIVVIIFSRQFGYHQGLILLMTNTLTTVDPALESRLYLAVDYADFDMVCHEKIWSNIAELGENGDIVSLEASKLKSRVSPGW